MATMVDSLVRESELLALHLHEEELQAQRDALLARRLALAYASRANESDSDDVEFVMEVAQEAAEQDDDVVELVQVDTQLAEVHSKQGQVAASQLHDQFAAQAQTARDSRAVAVVLDEHEKRHEQIAQHDAAFARRLATVGKRKWNRFGDEIEEPLNLPPPRKLPKLAEAPDTAAAAAGPPSNTAAAAQPGARRAAAAAAPVGHTCTTQPAPRAMTAGAVSRTTPGRQTQSQTKPQEQPSGCRPTGAAAAHGLAASSGPTDPRKRESRHVTPSPAKASAGARASATATAGRSNGAGPSAAAGLCAAPGPSAAPPRVAGAGASAGAGPSGSAAHSVGVGTTIEAAPAGPTTECMCCFDRFPDHAVTCAGADAASSSTASAGCGHYLYGGCMTQYVLSALKDRKFPVLCPMAGSGGGAGGCKVILSRIAVMDALSKHPKDQQAFGLLEAEQAIDPKLRIYCPHKSCSMPLQRPDDRDMPQEEPTSCPACNRMFCLRCLIPGWHHGYTCAQFQELPANLRSAEDAAMLQFSARQQWKQCPQCKQMVERSEGCNHMLCRCNCGFCYACGQQYRDAKPTAVHAHGTPACACPLFDVPAEEDDAEDGRRNDRRRHRNHNDDRDRDRHERDRDRDRERHDRDRDRNYDRHDRDRDRDRDHDGDYQEWDRRDRDYDGDRHQEGRHNHDDDYRGVDRYDDGGEHYDGSERVRDEDSDDGSGYGYAPDAAAAAGVAPAGWAPPAGYVAVQPAPWTGYAPQYMQPAAYQLEPPAPREVKRRRCRYSSSVNDCPYGRRCWYWHEEDDEAQQ